MKGHYTQQVHQSMNLHFMKTGGYNCFKYNFKTSDTEENFKTNAFRWQFVGLEKKSEHVIFTVFMVFKQMGFKWVVPAALFKQARALEWKTPEEFYCRIEEDLIYLHSQYSETEIFEYGDGLYPNIYDEYNQGNIDLLTLLCIDVFIKTVINKDSSRDIIVWPAFVEQMEKVKPFVEMFFSKQTFENLFVQHYLS